MNAVVLSLLCLALLSAWSQPARSAEPPVQGAALLKTDLLGVFAHPDDETGMASTLAHYALGEGRSVACVYATRGEGGGNMVGTQGGPALGLLREIELRECLRRLGVRQAHFLDQTDFFYTESLWATLKVWNHEEALRRLVRIVRSLRPEVIVTMNPVPNPGQHGHHQAAGILATEAFTAAADPTRFPEQLGPEGLSTWQARRLFYGGSVGTEVFTIATTRPLPDGRTPGDVAGDALSQHRSQGFGGFAGSPWLRRPQAFSLIKSFVPAPNTADLLSGLPVAEPGPPLQLATAPSPAPLGVRPRPGVARFRTSAGEQGLAHLAANFAADLPVVAGRPNIIFLESAGSARPTGVAVELPPGWKHGPARPAREHPGAVAIEVEPPAGVRGDVEVVFRARAGDHDLTAPARLHPVPAASAPRLRQAPALGGDQGWAGATRLELTTNLLWQGSVQSPADCSAEVRVAVHQEVLYLDFQVRDDVIVANLEPNDIKGHWRTDALEVCLDAHDRPEDTTGSFKLGIIPFDRTGRVRAARDADARQGPVEETAPGVELFSARTADGYHVQAAIPLRLVQPEGRLAGRRWAFNVLIYDGDKADAAPGENVNEARLAWSPRPGVQGRPEDWGELVVE